MAAWTLAAVVLCAQFEIRESVKESLFRKLKLLSLWNRKKPDNCVADCEECGTHKNPLLYTILITKAADESNYRFATLIGKRLALSTKNSSWSIITPVSDYLVLLMVNGVFSHAVEYRITAIEKSTKSNGDGITLLVLNMDIPNDMKPACLPKSKLDTELHVEFVVPAYTKGTMSFNGAKVHEFPVTLMKRILKIFREKDANHRLLELDYNENDKAAHFPVVVPGGSALHELNGRYTVLGPLKWAKKTDTMNYDLCIVAIDEDCVVEWIHKAAGNNCACVEPKAKLTRY